VVEAVAMVLATIQVHAAVVAVVEHRGIGTALAALVGKVAMVLVAMAGTRQAHRPVRLTHGGTVLLAEVQDLALAATLMAALVVPVGFV